MIRAPNIPTLFRCRLSSTRNDFAFFAIFQLVMALFHLLNTLAKSYRMTRIQIKMFNGLFDSVAFEFVDYAAEQNNVRNASANKKNRQIYTLHFKFMKSFAYGKNLMCSHFGVLCGCVDEPLPQLKKAVCRYHDTDLI